MFYRLVTTVCQVRRYSVQAACQQELENCLHGQKREKQDELREIANKLISGEVLCEAVGSELSAYEHRCSALISQVSRHSDFIIFANLGSGSSSAVACAFVSVCSFGVL